MRPFLRRPTRAAAAPLACALILALAGCGSSHVASLPTAPAADRVAPADVATSVTLAAPTGRTEGYFVHLAVGDHSEADRTFRARIFPNGGGEPGDWFTVHDHFEWTIEGTEVLGDETYFVQRETYVEDDGSSGNSINLYREDRSGLYLYQDDVAVALAGHAPGASAWEAHVLARADRALAERGLAPAARLAYGAALRAQLARLSAARGLSRARSATLAASGRSTLGIAPHEITILRYPLVRGASWEGRVGFNVWTVEGRESLALPAGRFEAVRLDIDLPAFFGPNDRYTTWYADPGEVAHAGFVTYAATDNEGNVIGTAESEDRLELTRWEAASGR